MCLSELQLIYDVLLITFRSLRTLLLEGNRLTTLPPQLGRLRHLSGLNLSNNPLESPPKCIIEKGTKVQFYILITSSCIIQVHVLLLSWIHNVIQNNYVVAVCLTCTIVEMFALMFYSSTYYCTCIYCTLIIFSL